MSRPKVQARLSDSLLTRVDAMAAEEKRPRSQMLAVLVGEAVTMREMKTRGEHVRDIILDERVDPDEPEYRTVEHPSSPDPKPKRHFHRYEVFVEEARPDKGVRMGVYRCECGRVNKQILDGWNRAVIDQEKR